LRGNAPHGQETHHEARSGELYAAHKPRNEGTTTPASGWVSRGQASLRSVQLVDFFWASESKLDFEGEWLDSGRR
jgi:hypothetical protein